MMVYYTSPMSYEEVEITQGIAYSTSPKFEHLSNIKYVVRYKPSYSVQETTHEPTWVLSSVVRKSGTV